MGVHLHARTAAGLFLLLCLVLQGCATSAPPGPEPRPGLPLAGDFGVRPAIPTPAQLHELDPRDRRDFLDYLADPANAGQQRHQLVADYLDQLTADFHYQGFTYSAAETLRGSEGNCLSLAILTTALARLADVEISYQLMDDVPVFEFKESLVKKGVHVRSKLLEPGWEPPPGEYALVRPGIQVDYFPSKRQRFIANIGEDAYLAMYYRNIAAEAIERRDYRTAWWYARESLAFAPDHSAGLNMLAVVSSRRGYAEQAEAIYLYAIERAGEKLSLLKNYRALLVRQDRLDEARAIQRRLDGMEDPSPFNWFQLARSTYQDGEFAKAIRYYRRVLELAPYLHEAHLELAQAYYMSGRIASARFSLENALEHAHRTSTHALYQAKLEALNREARR